MTIIRKKHGYIAHIETHSNEQQAQKRLNHHKQKWNNEDYHVSIKKTLLGLETDNQFQAFNKMHKQSKQA
tara:strand:+ start:414 stop:623 length:210 start_codon:yes stop_codon:yes gene_type:complete